MSAGLAAGVDLPDRTGDPVRFRLLRPGDDIEALTTMLHDAYRPLAEAGMRYMASHQSPEITRRRMRGGETIVAVVGERIVGVITWKPPGAKDGSPHYLRPGVASFGQYAVDPAFQGRGIGARLLELVEARAAEQGSAHLALDTSEDAARLLALYERKGFRFVEHVRWDGVNYRSVVLSKALTAPGPTPPPPAS